MVTLKDIAESAGVSVSAASLAIRDHRSISRETKQRVWSAQEKLGYYRHANSRLKKKAAKVGGATRSIAFLLVGRQFSDLAYASDFEAVASAVSEEGFLPVYLSAHPEEIREGRFPHPLKNREVDGVIVSGVYDEEEHRQLKRLGIPIVVLGNYDLGAEPWAACEMDNRGAVRLMVDRVSELGHRKLALLTCSSALEAHDQIKKSYLDRVAKNNLIDCGIGTVEGGKDIRNSLMALLQVPNRPTALVLPLSGEMLNVYDICGELGLSVPGDISVICFGVSAPTLRPTAAGVQSCRDEMAKRAIEKLSQMMENPDCVPTREIFPTYFTPGGSVAPYAGE